jgi:hypothetical protein
MSATTTTSVTPGEKDVGGGLALPIVGIIGAVFLILVGLLMAMRRDERLPTAYGQRRGGEAARSVNGTAVLAEMFRQQGHRVTTTSRFSPRLKKFDVIVWVPDDFEPPDKEHRDYLEQWLQDDPYRIRTVIYVGRDYNAAIDYWERVVPETPSAQAAEARHRQVEARAAWESARSTMPANENADWFTARRDGKPEKIDKLEGPWSEGIDASKTDIRLEGRLDMPKVADQKKDDPPPHNPPELLLGSGTDALAFRITDEKWNDGQVIVIANGSFVLNYPLVNHEHRKLAARLIEECSDGQNVIFVESDSTGPRIINKDPVAGMPSSLELLKVWPLNAILLHLTVLGILLCLARSPIFGRPRELPGDSPADFGKHVAALGKLLAATKDRNYAHARLVQYRQIAERRSGRSHLKSK